MITAVLRVVLIALPLSAFGLDQQLDVEYISIDKSNNIVNTIYKGKYYYENEDNSVALAVIGQKSNNKYYNYLDLQEFYYNYQQDNYEFKVGFDTTFWGVAESYNPVDIINQKNNLSSANKAKLSEMMLVLNYFFDEDSIEVLYLPYFREQKFTTFDVGQTTFEDKTPAFALKYKGIIDTIDYSASYFKGIERLPSISVVNANKVNTHYNNVEQLGVEIQLTTENILWKLEYAYKKYTRDSDDVFVAGFEYLLGSEIEANILVEILRNTNAQHIFADDVMVGLRLNLNNENSSEGLFSVIYDRKYHSKMAYLNFNQRIFSDYKLDISARYNFNKHADNAIANSKNQLGITVFYYF